MMAAMFRPVSACCHREVIVRQGMEYPIGGQTWGIPFKYDACSGCGLDIDGYAYECEVCGEVGCGGCEA